MQHSGGSFPSASSSSCSRPRYVVPYDGLAAKVRRRGLSKTCLLLAGLSALPSAVHALTTECRKEFDAMRSGENYLIQYAQFWTYCNLRCQNKLTSCCSTVDFENQIATGCGTASCIYY